MTPWNKVLPDLHFRQILKKINIFLFHMLTKKIKQSCLDLYTMIKLNKLNYPLRLRLLSVERLSSEDSPYHNCGTISFNPRDNYLYICLGDTMSS